MAKNEGGWYWRGKRLSSFITYHFQRSSLTEKCEGANTYLTFTFIVASSNDLDKIATIESLLNAGDIPWVLISKIIADKNRRVESPVSGNIQLVMGSFSYRAIRVARLMQARFHFVAHRSNGEFIRYRLVADCLP